MYECSNKKNTNNGDFMKYIKIIIIFFFIATIIRIIYLYHNKDYYNNLYYDKTNIYVYGPSAPRGRILDINGKVLVDNKALKTIFYHKDNNNDEIEISLSLADLLDVQETNDEDILRRYYYVTHKEEVDSLITNKEYELLGKRKITLNEINKLKLKRINPNKLNTLNKKAAYIYDLMQKGYSYENKIIAKDVSDEVYAKVLEKNIKGVFGGITWERYYPYNDTLRSILGNVGNIPKEEKEKYLKKGYGLTDQVGISYLELQYEDYLKGNKAKYKVLNDNTLYLVEEEKQGNDLILNIDIDIQIKLDEIIKSKILKAKKEKNTGYYKDSYVVISNPNTGAIIALSGQRYLKDKIFQDISTNIINSSFTVGSVVKGATITVGYNNNIINEKTKVKDDCVKLYLTPKKCSYKRLGIVNDITALKESSNYFQFLIAIGLTNNKYHYNMQINATKEHFDIYRNTLADYGLGVLTGIDLPNEKEGIKGNIVSDDLLLNLSIGQYDTYTPIMLSTYINTIASKGYVKTPKLLNKIVDNSNTILESDYTPIRKVTIKDEYLDRIRTGFNLVTMKGTGRGYITSEVTSAGKTGTSQSFYDSDNNGTYESETITTSFVGFFPFEDPKYSIAIISPNISNYKDNKEYISRVNRYIASDISKYLANK